MGGLHVREDGDGAVLAQLLAAAHGVDRHLAELGPGQGAAGAEGAVLIAVQHAQKLQRLDLGGGVQIRHVGKGPGRIGAGGQGADRPQGGQQAQRQQRGYDAFLHLLSTLLYSARSASTGWSFDAFAAG